MEFNIQALSLKLKKEIQHKIDFKTKPTGSLGVLEEIALKIGSIQNSLTPIISKPAIVVFAGDHGVVKNQPVSPFPQEVTAQMVFNFLQGGAAINVFTKLNKIQLKVVDAGVNFEFEKDSKLIDAKIKKGTEDYTISGAMTLEECSKAIEKGAEIVTKIYSEGCNTIGFGEMGIGNTASASLLMSAFTKEPLEVCTGKGTGHTEEGVLNKIEILKKAQELHKGASDPLHILANYGGFEIAMMTGAMLQAATLKMCIVIDGFIVTVALLAAFAKNKNVLDYCLFAHNSGEKGHQKMLDYLKVKPIVNLGLRLGEGTGAALVIPTIKAAVAFFNEMASFESAGVTNK
ncbi:nicotinate-nucleotide--dimethylbenzimidazole phosphoribosyltransferase [Flavicella sediminum]|uniref:nicotinate-nucleotide--dimethylbenzimidazole phosphoribosyltransferase n=1 Tax=Flavicella sediminum TaxID=2585141 RepID=UPI00112336B2|nr:nicotinate-nucleotide--dimethylbenzimidazole phosphoribosyltransferase [Flavicella sediminum]